MKSNCNQIIWQQFGASIDMLENAMRACPEALWNTKANFWYISYHTLFWLDYYLTDEPMEFSPPPPFTLSEFDPEGTLPDRPYEKQELSNYLEYGRQKAHALITGSDLTDGGKRFKDNTKDYSRLEILLYNMRHVQHHAAQLNLILRQEIDAAPGWVSRAT